MSRPLGDFLPRCKNLVGSLDNAEYYYYNYRMARPPKDARLRMSTDLRIPVTSEQKRLIADALADEPDGLAAWARGVLLHAAKERLTVRLRHDPANSSD